eukprot:8178444-Ditylum_brightwellii.AAC.1
MTLTVFTNLMKDLVLFSMLKYLYQYCSVRNMWEKFVAGEVILSQTKPLVKDLRTNLHVSAGLRHHHLKSIKTVVEPDLEKE